MKDMLRSLPRCATRTFAPPRTSRVTAHLIGPAGVSATVELDPVTNSPGRFQADWTRRRLGCMLPS